MKSYAALPALIVGCAGTLASYAVPVQMGNPFAFRSDRTANSLGLLQSSIVIGVNGVTPNSLDGSAAGAQTTVTATQGSTSVSLGKIQAAVGTPFRDSYIAQVAYDPALTGVWAVTTANPVQPTPSSLTLNTVGFGPVESVPFVASMSLSGAGTDLTLEWVQPATNDRIDRQTIFVFEQQANGSYLLIFSQELGTAAREFNLGGLDEIPTVLNKVDIGTNYVISIDTSDNAPGVGTIASSASYFNFTPTPAQVEVYLPSVGEPGVSNYNVQVSDGQPVSLITQGGALGYKFVADADGPLFQSLALPTIGGDLFDLWLFDELGNAFLADQIGQGSSYDFGQGVSSFLLFAPGAGSGPNATTDFSFASSLSFTQNGTFTGTISALALDPRPTSVPEPGTLGLLGAGLGLLALRRRKRHG